MKQIAIALFTALMLMPAWAVQNNSAYVTTQPTNTQVPNWTSGWPQSGTTGWNYVGAIGSASGVYLYNGWVITAAHVGAGNFVLGTTTYTPIAGTTRSLTNP